MAKTLDTAEGTGKLQQKKLRKMMELELFSAFRLFRKATYKWVFHHVQTLYNHINFYIRCYVAIKLCP